MKRKIMKRVFCVLLSVVILASGFTAFAADISPRYDATSRITANLSINSSGLASCRGTIALRDLSYTATLTLHLQRYQGGSWTDVYSWSTSDAVTLSKSRYVVSGYSYRVVTSATVYSASGAYIESPSATSSTVYY